MVGFSRVLRAGLVAALGLSLLGLASCSEYGGVLPKHMRPLDEKIRELIARKGMDERSPILLRLFKEESALEVWKRQRSSGRYALLKTYEICAWSGVLGPKIKEGDRQAPEGFYTIRPAQMNPNSSYHLSFNMGYPNDFDRAYGRTGSELMVHGACSSRGCYSMTDENIQEIYTLGRLAFEGGQRDFQVQAFPFRMTAENVARHRSDPNIPFWLMLKEGYDHFEAVGQPPKVDVCDRRYVFNSVPDDGKAFYASAACPPMSMPEPIRLAMAEKEAKDRDRMLSLAARLDRKESRNGLATLTAALSVPTSATIAVPMSTAIAAAAPADTGPTTTASVDAPAAETPLPPAASVQQPALAATEAPISEPAEPVALVSTAANPPAPAPAPPPASSPAPASAETVFLPLPELGPSQPEAPAAAPQEAAPDAASVEERMLVESAPADPGVANAYASASEEDGGLTGLVLRLFQQ